LPLVFPPKLSLAISRQERHKQRPPCASRYTGGPSRPARIRLVGGGGVARKAAGAVAFTRCRALVEAETWAEKQTPRYTAYEAFRGAS